MVRRDRAFVARRLLLVVHPGSDDTGPEWPAECSIDRKGAAREAWAALLHVAHSESRADAVPQS
jgi:hypothetical protein